MRCEPSSLPMWQECRGNKQTNNRGREQQAPSSPNPCWHPSPRPPRCCPRPSCSHHREIRVWQPNPWRAEGRGEEKQAGHPLSLPTQGVSLGVSKEEAQSHHPSCERRRRRKGGGRKGWRTAQWLLGGGVGGGGDHPQ